MTATAAAAPGITRDVRANPTNRHGQYTETTDYLKMVRRMIRAAGRRVGDMDLAELPALAALADEADRVLKVAARALHAQGYSWGEIGRELGVTRQAAFHRFGRRRGETTVTTTTTVTTETRRTR